MVTYVENTTVPEEPIVEVKAEPEPVHIDEVTLTQFLSSIYLMQWKDLEARNVLESFIILILIKYCAVNVSIGKDGQNFMFAPEHRPGWRETWQLWADHVGGYTQVFCSLNVYFT